MHQVVYACWTFIGGLIFGGAYLGTHGGLLVPILLHFGNNAAVFAASLQKVAHAMLAQRRGYMEVADRVRSEQRRGAGGAGGAGGTGEANEASARLAAVRAENAKLRARMEAASAERRAEAEVAPPRPQRSHSLLDDSLVVPMARAGAAVGT